MASSIELLTITPTSPHRLSTTHSKDRQLQYEIQEEIQRPNSNNEPLQPVLTSSISRADYTFPEGGTRAWLVILGSFCIICGTFGLISSVGLFQAYWQAHQLSQYSSRDLGWISAVNVFLNLFLGVQIGPLFDRYGPRWLVAGGSVVYVARFVLPTILGCGRSADGWR